MYPPVRDERRFQLTDPWFRAEVKPERLAELYDPEYLQRWVDAWRRAADPFSESSLRVQRFVDVANAGGTFTETDGTTGEILDQWEAGPQPGERPLN